MSAVEDKLTAPSARWRRASSVTLFFTGGLAKLFLKTGTAKNEVHGLDKFVKLLDERSDVAGRQRGLLTVSNHLAVVDDPLLWGVLPFRHYLPDNIRWSLGSYDICFKDGHSSTLAKYFCLGQTLPTHRNAYSPYGGLFQPTITQCIRLLSGGPFTKPTPPHPSWSSGELDGQHKQPAHIDDPFSEPTFTFSTTEYDEYPAPSAYGTRRHAWVHIFPEGKIHQHPERIMSYFKWGVARLILESDVCPMVLPIWHEGADQIMHESRTFPRFLPRLGKKFSLTFGEPVPDNEWTGFRERWRKLKERELKREGRDLDDSFDFLNDELRYGREARELRMEVTFAVRDQILRLRRSRGYTDEDPKARLADTYKAEGAKREGKMDDDSWVKDT